MSSVKKSAFALSALTLAMLAPVVQAGVAFNVGAVSDYRFRGISQSAEDPAIQGGVDYSHASGFYLGVWGSNVDFNAGPGADPDANLEVDLYGGYKWKAASVDWDAGFIHYAYPNATSSFKLPFTEVYVGGTYGMANFKYFYTNDFTGTTKRSASDLTVGGNFDLGGGYTLGASVGRSSGGGIEDTLVSINEKSYTDYKLGVSKDYAGLTFNVSYVDTNIDFTAGAVKPEVSNSDSTVVLSVLKAF